MGVVKAPLCNSDVESRYFLIPSSVRIRVLTLPWPLRVDKTRIPRMMTSAARRAPPPKVLRESYASQVRTTKQQKKNTITVSVVQKRAPFGCQKNVAATLLS